VFVVSVCQLVAAFNTHSSCNACETDTFQCYSESVRQLRTDNTMDAQREESELRRLAWRGHSEAGRLRV